MVAVLRCLKEKMADVYDWLDYRPDADLRPLLAVPVLLAIGLAYGSVMGLGIAVAIALMVTVGVAVIGGTVIATWIVANALLDMLFSFRLRPASKVQPVQRTARM